MYTIAIDARESGTTTGRYVDKLIEYLYKLRPNYKIILLAKAHRIDYLRSVASDFEVIECPYKEFTFAEQIGLLRQLNKLKADLVHFPMVQQPVLYKGKVVTTMQDLTTLRFRNPAKNWLAFTIKRWVYRWVNKKVARKSAALITPSKFVRNDVAKFAHLNSNVITVTYEAADKIAEAAELVQKLGNAQYIMYVGRPLPHKNLGRLISAYKVLKSSRPDLKLVLAGKLDKLYKNYQQKNTDPDIIFTDFVSEGQLRWLYEHTDAYVFPSLSEGFGLPALEAMAHGAPVVSSNATCLPEIYQGSAHYFDPMNVDDMAQKIGEVLDQPKLREQLIIRGSKLVESYSWQRMAEETLAVYQKVLGN